LIADSIGIQQHLKDTYNKDSHFIAYGADIFDQPDVNVIQPYDVEPYKYYMLMARMEPENNIEMILQGYVESSAENPLLVVGKTNNEFGTMLVNRYGQHKGIKFLGGIYNIKAVNNLRYYSGIYFHGHSVGGTNPSLLEAMSSNALIAAHDNVFNKTVLERDAFYFSTPAQVADIIRNYSDKASHNTFIQNNLNKIRTQYSWARITDLYEHVLLDAVK
jgi:hypothetical protein